MCTGVGGLARLHLIPLRVYTLKRIRADGCAELFGLCVRGQRPLVLPPDCYILSDSFIYYDYLAWFVHILCSGCQVCGCIGGVFFSSDTSLCLSLVTTDDTRHECMSCEQSNIPGYSLTSDVQSTVKTKKAY